MRVKGLLPSPAFFRRIRPKITCTAPNNPSRPTSFLRQFSPQHSPVARPFRGKKGLFCPQRPPYPPPKGARTPRFAPAPPGFCPARPGKSPGSGPKRHRQPARKPVARTTPDARKRPRVRLLRPPAPVFLPPAAFRPLNTPMEASTPPKLRPPSPPSARGRRPKASPFAPPRPAFSLGKPDCRGRLSRFAVEKCAPSRGGGSDPWA